MNQHLPRQPRLPTQAAEGLPRWRWTLAEFDRFIELGIFDADDRIELIGGELVPMSARGIAHETVKTDIKDLLGALLPKSLRLETELAWRPDDDSYCEPDILICPRRWRPPSKVPASEVLLLIEVADSTLKKDTTTKAALYSRLGVPEYWVVNAFTLATHVHASPAADGYRSVKLRKPTALLKPHLLPDIALRMKDLGIEI